MIVSYDSIAKAIYVKIKPEARVDRTIEFAPETFVDLDVRGDLIGIEMLNPAQIILKRIAKKFHLPEISRIDPGKLKAAVV